jgi:hypothetical protein
MIGEDCLRVLGDLGTPQDDPRVRACRLDQLDGIVDPARAPAHDRECDHVGLHGDDPIRDPPRLLVGREIECGERDPSLQTRV